MPKVNIDNIPDYLSKDSSSKLKKKKKRKSHKKTSKKLSKKHHRESIELDEKTRDVNSQHAESERDTQSSPIAIHVDTSSEAPLPEVKHKHGSILDNISALLSNQNRDRSILSYFLFLVNILMMITIFTGHVFFYDIFTILFYGDILFLAGTCCFFLTFVISILMVNHMRPLLLPENKNKSNLPAQTITKPAAQEGSESADAVDSAVEEKKMGLLASLKVQQVEFSLAKDKYITSLHKYIHICRPIHWMMMMPVYALNIYVAINGFGIGLPIINSATALLANFWLGCIFKTLKNLKNHPPPPPFTLLTKTTLTKHF